MIKCPNCGAENSDSAMFCENCGTKIPHEKECPGCHAKVKLTAKFCGKCGYNFNARQSTSAADKGMAIGDKNVIAGDVIGNQETFKIEGAATIVKNEDETKKMVKCHVCGHNITILQSIDCPVCHQTICEKCYDASKNMCAECISRKNTDKEKNYIQALKQFLEDDKITLDERQELNALQKELGIAPTRASELEKQIKNESVAAKNIPVLSRYVKISLEKALDIFYGQGNVQEAYKLLKPFYERYPQNEEILTSFLYASIKVNPEEALKIIQQNQADVIGISLVCIDYDLMRHDLDSADGRLTAAMRLWPDNLLLGCRKALCLKAMYDEFKMDLLLQQAAEILSALPKPQNKLESSWFCKTQFTVYCAMGNEIPEIDKKYCEEHNLYYALSCPDIPRCEKKSNPAVPKEGTLPAEEKKQSAAVQKKENVYEIVPAVSTAPSSSAGVQSFAADTAIFTGHSLNLRISSISGNQTHPSKSPAEIYKLALSNKERDKNLYMQQLQAAAEAGYAPAQYDLMAALPERNDEEKKIAASWCIKAAEQGYAKAQYILGARFSVGAGVQVDKKEAVKWYRKAADQGLVEAQHNLGVSYASGNGVEKNAAEATKWFRKAAEQGFANAQNRLGLAYDTGMGVEKNAAEAVKWYRKAANQGLFVAQYNLGLSYALGNGVEKNAAEAVKWYRKAAEQGYANAQNKLGFAYGTGMGVEKNAAEAVKWYRKAAEQGLAAAQYNLGVYYDSGNGVEKNAAEAVKWYRKAAEQGLAAAQYNLGVLYDSGDGVEKNAEEAEKWYRKAAKQGHASAQYKLGKIYYFKTTSTETQNFFFKAAEQGHKEAMYEIGSAYMDGHINLPKDYVQGEKWLLKAAEAGSRDAQWYLGELYREGDRLGKDFDRARLWYKKASDQGSHWASFYLASLTKDRQEMYRLLCKAAEQGNPYAKKMIEKKK